MEIKKEAEPTVTVTVSENSPSFSPGSVPIVIEEGTSDIDAAKKAEMENGTKKMLFKIQLLTMILRGV